MLSWSCCLGALQNAPAKAFTRHFDLIAERKSVIFHLRELAKAKGQTRMWLTLCGQDMCVMYELYLLYYSILQCMDYIELY